ncbi:MAG: hypothetical protein WC322_05515 [Candidatus Paceibacterota bacterium]|jgi:adenosine deaminase
MSDIYEMIDEMDRRAEIERLEQNRIDELTEYAEAMRKAWFEAERRLEQLEKENAELRRKKGKK